MARSSSRFVLMAALVFVLAASVAETKSKPSVKPKLAQPMTVKRTNKTIVNLNTKRVSTAAASASPKAGWVKRMLTLVNRARKKAGLGPVCLNLKLMQSAQAQSDWMVRLGDISHQGPNGESFTSRLEQFNYDWGCAGENVAWGFSDSTSVHKAFMDSPGHRANILNPCVTMMGVSRVLDDGRYGIQTHYWTVHFAAPWVAGRGENCIGSKPSSSPKPPSPKPPTPSPKLPSPAPISRKTL